MEEESKLQRRQHFGGLSGANFLSVQKAGLGGQRCDPSFTGCLGVATPAFWRPEACNLERTWNISPGVGSLIVFWTYLNVAPLIPNKPHSTPFHSRMPCQSLTGCPVKDSSFLLADSSFSWSREWKMKKTVQYGRKSKVIFLQIC